MYFFNYVFFIEWSDVAKVTLFFFVSFLCWEGASFIDPKKRVIKFALQFIGIFYQCTLLSMFLCIKDKNIGPFLFTTNCNKRINRTYLLRDIKMQLDKANRALYNDNKLCFTSHGFRANYAAHMLNKTSILNVAAMLGHTNINTTVGQRLYPIDKDQLLLMTKKRKNRVFSFLIIIFYCFFSLSYLRYWIIVFKCSTTDNIESVNKQSDIKDSNQTVEIMGKISDDDFRIMEEGYDVDLDLQSEFEDCEDEDYDFDYEFCTRVNCEAPTHCSFESEKV